MQLFDVEVIRNLFRYDPQAPLIFNSGFFLFFFMVFLLLYVELRKDNWLRMLYVTLVSYFFYYKCSGSAYWVLAFVTIWDFILARMIAAANHPRKKQIFLGLSIMVNLGLLCYFKYTNFLYDLYCNLMNEPFDPFNIVLPVGISFFTFQSMSYTIDVYRGQLKPLTSLLSYAFFVSFFPPLVAGPIVRAKDFIPQIIRPLFVSREMFGWGVFLILIGLFKKAVISDYISINFVDRIFDNPTLYSGVENLFGVYGYALQIYCDFSGYSDMAIGIALLLGFQFNVNFDSPYQSATITEFWRRWHISLSSWLRDYLYISLGGNRKGKFRTYVNLFVTMLLGGLWHGASLRFLCWGALHGAALAGHKLLMTVFPQFKSSGEGMKPLQKIGGVLLTFHLVCFSWIFFRAESFDAAIGMIKQIATSFHASIFVDMVKGYPWVFVLMAVGFILHFIPVRWEETCKQYIIQLPLWGKATAMLLIIIFVMQIKSAEIQAFIYFQF